jgi:hypothetical protein
MNCPDCGTELIDAGFYFCNTCKKHMTFEDVQKRTLENLQKGDEPLALTPDTDHHKIKQDYFYDFITSRHKYPYDWGAYRTKGNIRLTKLTLKWWDKVVNEDEIPFSTLVTELLKDYHKLWSLKTYEVDEFGDSIVQAILYDFITAMGVCGGRTEKQMYNLIKDIMQSLGVDSTFADGWRWHPTKTPKWHPDYEEVVCDECGQLYKGAWKRRNRWDGNSQSCKKCNEELPDAVSMEMES